MGKIKNLLSKTKRLAWGHKKISLVVFIALLIVGFLVWPKGAKPILTEVAKNQDVVKTVSVTGKIDSDSINNLTFQFGGKIIYLGAKEGDSVKKWQAIASLDQNQLQASFRQAQQDFIAAKAASQQYYDNHTNATESNEEKVQRTAIDAAQNKAYDQMMKVQQDLNNSTLYSPIDGILTSMGVNSTGVNVTSATVFTVTDPAALTFNMDVDETDVGSVKSGQDVTVTLDAFPNNPVKLSIQNIAFVSHTTTSGGNAFAVKAIIPSNSGYRIGMNGNADIIVAKKNNVLAIPASSIFDDNYVYVKNDGSFEKRKVRLGLQSDTLAQVLEGVSDGEIVAIDPSTVPQNLIKK